jgi:hypothetical protein
MSPDDQCSDEVNQHGREAPESAGVLDAFQHSSLIDSCAVGQNHFRGAAFSEQLPHAFADLPPCRCDFRNGILQRHHSTGYVLGYPVVSDTEL